MHIITGTIFTQQVFQFDGFNAWWLTTNNLPIVPYTVNYNMEDKQNHHEAVGLDWHLLSSIYSKNQIH